MYTNFEILEHLLEHLGSWHLKTSLLVYVDGPILFGEKGGGGLYTWGKSAA